MNYVPKRFHELLSKVAVTEEEVMLERGEVIKEAEFLCEDFKQASRGGAVCTVDTAFQSRDIAVLEDYREASVQHGSECKCRTHFRPCCSSSPSLLPNPNRDNCT